jgi:microcystin-dependent protein
MSKSLVLAALLMGSTAFACPDLSGTYVCQSEQGPVESVVTQAVVNGVTVFTETSGGESSSMAADGKAVTSVEKEEGVVYTMTQVATCSADALNIDINLVVADEAGNKLGEVTALAAVSLDASKNLQTVTTSQGQSETTVCTRK